MSANRIQRAFKFPYAADNFFGDKTRNIILKLHIAVFGLGVQNCDASFQFRRLNRDRQTRTETGYQPVLNFREIFEETVAGNNYLFFAFKQRIECQQKFLLRGVCTGKKMNIIH